MGLFSSKYVTNVGTTVSRVIEDSTLPNSVKHGAMKGLFDNSEDSQFIEHILEELSTSVAVRADRMYSYGRDHYLFGLPSGSIQESSAGKEVVQAVIEAEVGQTVTMNYYHYGALNNLHLAYVKLISDHGYNPLSNVLAGLSTIKGVPVQLNKVTVVVTNASLAELNNGSLDQFDAPMGTPALFLDDDDLNQAMRKLNKQKKPQLFELDAAAASDYVRVDYSWKPADTVLTGSFTIPITGFDEEADWHQAKYTRADGQIGYWLYNASDLLHPTVDELHNPAYLENGSYFPFGYFRWNKVAGNADIGSNEYKQSKKLMKHIGIDYDQIADAIGENPDIAQVESAMLTMAVPANTTDQLEMRYLFDYFSSLYNLTGGELKPPEKGQGIAEMLDSSRTDTAIIIQDARFKMALGFRRIYKQTVTGNIGKVGTMASGMGGEVVTEQGRTAETHEPVSWNTVVDGHWYRKQITDVLYEEIKISNLRMTYFVYGDYTAVGDENDDILLVPIDRSICHHWTLADRETLYARSLHYVFNCRTVTEVKWYQQGWFKALLVIAAVIITIATYGETWQAIGAALSAGTISVEAVIYMIAIEVIKYVAINVAIHLFIKLVGVKIAFIVAVLAALAGSYQAIEAGSIKGAPWAQELLQLSTGLSKGIGTELQGEMIELQQEAQEFGLFVKSEQKRLEEANKLLQDNNWLSPFIVFGESPNEYYQRTVHSGNIGVLGLDAITVYVDTQLRLPELNDTV